MRKRILALTMNTVERVAELFVGDCQQVPSFSRCPEVMETYLNALEHVFEGLIRYGSIAVPLPSWKGDSKAKCEEFVANLQRLGLPSECFKPKDLRLNEDYRSLAASSLIEASKAPNFEMLIHQAPWREFAYRESLQFQCPLSKDVRDIWPSRYVDEETFNNLISIVPKKLVDNLCGYLQQATSLGEGQRLKSRVELYIISSLLRARESSLIYRDVDADYYPFILHAPLEVIDSTGLSSASNPSFGKNSRIVHCFLRSFLTDIIDRVKSDPDDIWRRLAIRLDEPEVKSLQKQLQLIDSDIRALEEFEDALRFGDTVSSPEYISLLLSEGKDFVDLIPLIGKPLKGILSLCKVYISRSREKSLSRRFGKLIRRYKHVDKSSIDLQKRFEGLFADRFAD